jgi:hypothetical protein
LDCQIEWSNSKVEHGKLSVNLDPAPDFAFMLAFDEIVDPITHSYAGWGGVLLAHGHVIVSDVHAESAQELRTFLDETVKEANRLAVRERVRESEREQEEEARQLASAQAAAERDARLTDTFRRSG